MMLFILSMAFSALRENARTTFCGLSQSQEADDVMMSPPFEWLKSQPSFPSRRYAWFLSSRFMSLIQMAWGIWRLCHRGLHSICQNQLVQSPKMYHSLYHDHRNIPFSVRASCHEVADDNDDEKGANPQENSWLNKTGNHVMNDNFLFWNISEYYFKLFRHSAIFLMILQLSSGNVCTLCYLGNHHSTYTHTHADRQPKPPRDADAFAVHSRNGWAWGKVYNLNLIIVHRMKILIENYYHYRFRCRRAFVGWEWSARARMTVRRMCTVQWQNSFVGANEKVVKVFV